ncbi:DUF3168 domain-containing protein [Sinorhizobium meliloti]|uniref:DUF3168 domain-containing protein n=1 Tax=Rhizobium meliloti TaxID=382 RepID=UPI000FD383C5|nr:DUF3168 domain-containing protein [Sinorhizobium meliloti]MDW9818173.1 DUF3168 domain-containing protein [Sinorhizobium meliloti]MDW9855064.1 DUF3168 domain-containing protein [Sinorhizobium meliloti]MDW9872710.1 DUF3168 domain-containing protein [Sinorhizobium meliloti]MDW9886321.1 DUF3168 domain-containing protein [Sinorhizobium meliloti]MDX0208203.1 DUF3168 domain-containing protein [Sinorhizobium meliloti]
MSSSVELQDLYLNALKGNAAIMALVGGIYDRVPKNPYGKKTAYISFGADDSTENDAECITGREITSQLDVWSIEPGKTECKTIVDLVRRALHRQPLALTENALVDIWVTLVRVLPDPDGLTTHGVVQVTAMVEEPS